MPSSKPWPISPRMLRPGTRTSSKISDAGPPSPIVWMNSERQPIDRSTRNAVVPPPRTPFVPVGDRDDDREVGVVAVGDERLLAVEDPVVAVAAGAQLDVRGVRAGARLGDREAGDPVALDGREQVLLLLLLVGVVQDVVRLAAEPERHEACGRPRSRSATAVTAGRSIPPYSSGVDRPQKPNFFAFCCSSRSSLRSRPGWWRAFAAQHLLLQRHHLLGDELPGGVADRAFLVAEREVHVDKLAA